MKLMSDHRRHSGVHRSVIIAILIAIGVAVITVPMVGASSENIYVSCARPDAQKPAAKRHPNNCFISAAAVHQHNGVLVLLNFQQISWRDWGADTTRAVADSVNSNGRVRNRVHFSVSGRQTCSGLIYYAKIVLESPKRLYPRPVSLELGCGSQPEEPNTSN
jgi:hypothetical protein